ncbi:hypothetical protein [Vibrio sp. V39_P1S14PM300]|uniref:hypothetical protein n=1 Tax=Vibrio sp. V39_P1S14PM300 TaxID=1938690 RepID=UPI0013724346|nr:hypothetical protein [Vibrio sp. V39_P1S14PM300]NAX20222.1 hypothetical protein [Vibrio sp. V39_P1S14PM300]
MAPDMFNQDHEFFTKLRDLSKRGVGYIDDFRWTITGFGKDYRSGMNIGCANGKTERKSKKRISCKHRKKHPLGQHDLKNAKGQLMTKALVGNTLEIGK